MTTCTITFSAVDTALQVKPNSTLIFEPSPRVIRGVGATVMTPDTRRIVSDASGAGSIALVPGNYRLSMDTSGGSRQVDITVPATPTALLGDLIDTPLGEYEFSALQQLRADVTAAAGQVALDRGVVASDRVLSEAARVAAVAAAPIATDAAAQALVYRDQAALYAGSFGPGMILHRTDEAIPAGWWDTGLRQSATSELWGNTATLALISNWSTASLYTGGIATAFFDFSTVSREFQDVFGTALTAAGQSVAMVRDAISPLTFGASIVTNGDFAADANWTKGTGWTISGGSANKAAGTAAFLTQAVTLTAGRTYRIAGTATVTAGTVTPRFTGGTLAAGTAISAGGNFEQYVTAANGNTTLDFLGSSTFAGTIDNVSVQEVLGIVAIQPSASLRGVWGQWPVKGRRNLLLWSEDPTKSPWATVYASVNPAPSVLGYPMFTVTTSPDVITSTMMGKVQQSLSMTNGQYTWTNIQAANSDGLITMNVSAVSPAAVGGSAGSRIVVFNTVTQQFMAQNLGSGGVYLAENLGSGLWRITLTFNVTAPGTVFFARAVDQNTTAGISVGRSVNVGPMQVEAGAVATAYQRVDSVDYVFEAGARAAGFWRSDLVDDSLTFNLPAAVDGELILLGRDGSWRETRLASAGSQVVIGGTGAGTLATPGILRATGPLVAMGFRQGVMTADEWLRLKRRWRAEGARGELIAGANMILNGTFDADLTGWNQPVPARGPLSWSAGTMRIEDVAAASNNYVERVITTVAGVAYLFRAQAVEAVNAAPRIFAGISSGSSALGSSFLSASATGQLSLVFLAAGTSTRVNLNPMNSSAAGAFVRFDNVTVQPLTPEW